MALPWALAVLTLLPLLEAQSPACANLTAKPITNATLDWVSAGGSLLVPEAAAAPLWAFLSVLAGVSPLLLVLPFSFLGRGMSF